MKLFDFNRYFPDETACRKAFKEMRDREGVTCQHCGSHDVVWLESKQQYQCKHCRHNMVLRVQYLIVSNGLQHYCCRIDYETNGYVFLEDIPAYEEL